MRLTIVVLATAFAASISAYAAGPANAPRRAVAPAGAVVPPGTSLIVQTTDSVTANRALRGTVFGAIVAQNVVDQNGSVLISKGAPVDLVVRSLPYLGPGGVGMTELALDVAGVTVNGESYPVATQVRAPNAGGLGIHLYSAQLARGEEAGGPLSTVGRRVNVPSEAALAFQIRDPIRLRG
jgi:hypothetical protein